MQENTKENYSINKRISEIIEYLGISRYKMAQKTGISEAIFNNIDKNKNKASIDVVEKILNNYSVINAAWLVTGQGKMLNEHPNTINNEEANSKISDTETRPRVPMNAAAGALSIAIDGITIRDCEELPVIRAFSKYDFTIFAKGDSMEPEFHSGDELACLYIKNTTFVQWGRCHVLDTAQGIIVKRIFEEDEFIICKSHNAEYKDFSIHKSEVYNIALVIGLIRRY